MTQHVQNSAMLVKKLVKNLVNCHFVFAQHGEKELPARSHPECKAMEPRYQKTSFSKCLPQACLSVCLWSHDRHVQASRLQTVSEHGAGLADALQI